MIGWLTAIPDLIKGVFSVASKGLDYYIKLADGDTQRAVALMAADQARIQAQRDITVAGFNNPVFLIGWALFIFPLGIYWSKILIYDKVLELGTTDPLSGFVLEWGGWMVSYLFGLQVGAGVVGAILNRVVRR
jgi:hypothetical protein